MITNQEIKTPSRTLGSKIKSERLFLASLAALIISSIWFRRIPRYTQSDFKVVFTLMVFLIVVKGLEKSGFFQDISSRLEGKRFIPQKLIVATSIISMMVTNDVAVMAMVPITLSLPCSGVEWLVALEAVSANVASSLVPFGNPQNIFIYFHFHLHPVDFVKAIAPFTGILMGFILAISVVLEVFGLFSWENTEEVTIRVKSHRKGHSAVYLAFFVVFVLGVLRVLPLWVGIPIILYSAAFDRDTLKIDYFLLGIFVFFFGFTDNLMGALSIPTLKGKDLFFTSMLSSQIISNVPSALLFADFSSGMWKDLLWGVSVGGLGTLFGSLASLISYRLFRASRPSSSRKFLVILHAVNISALILGTLAYLSLGHL